MANKLYLNEETSLVWTDDATGGDYTLDIGGLAADGVRASDEGDLGAAPRSRRYRFTFVVDGFATAPVPGETVDVYLAFSHSGNQADRDGDLSGVDAASTTAVLPNLMHIGSAVVQTTTAANELVISGDVEISHRYVSVVIHNRTADALLSTSDAHKFILTPVPDEVQ